MYIKIQNECEIEMNAFKLIGASTKRDDSSKIGFFGSGLKYTMAYLLRAGIPFKIFSGEKEVVLTTKEELYRGKTFHVILINGEETSMTTEMGPNWQPWSVIRELYCNAIDEGNYKLETVKEAEPIIGSTCFYIKITPDFQGIIDNWNLYFSESRKDLVYSTEDGGTKIFHGGKGIIIYRKGIRCHIGEGTDSIFNYDFDWAKINESRVLDNLYLFEHQLIKEFAEKMPLKVIKRLVDNLCRSDQFFELSLPWHSCGTLNFSNYWLEAIAGRYLIEQEISGWYKDEIESDPSLYLILPAGLVERLDTFFNDKVQLMTNGSNGLRYKKVPSTPKYDFLLKEVATFFMECKYEVAYPMEIVMFDRGTTLGAAMDGKILLSNKLFDMGKRTIAQTIIEENEHLKTGFADETRSFQTHFIKLYLKEMEEKNSYFL